MDKWPALIALFLSGPATAAEPRLEPVVLHAVVNASPADVWTAITTPAGVQSFFSKDALVESRIDGAYEMYFLPGNPPGLRGGEGIRILAMESPRRFFISWNAPPKFREYREQKTVVEFELEPAAGNRTLLTLTHGGWGRVPRWADVRSYFADAWKTVVGRLQYRFDHGPIDWTKAPDGAAYFKPSP